MREITTVIVHCADTPAGMDIGAKEIAEWHIDGNGWDDIGYHYVIRRNGLLEDGRPVEIVGAHAYGHNKRSIGVCLVGGKGENGPEANFTKNQYDTLNVLLSCLDKRFNVREVYGHRDLDPNKTCPCFDVKAFFS